MTNPASNYVPYDDWFDNPLDSMPIATNGDDDMLDTMPSEYLNNLLNTFAKYPKYHDLMGELIKILNRYEKID